MEKIATSFCSFEGLVRKYTYVDKTDMLWRLVSDSTDRIFFISRPRRFGKSLMLDVLARKLKTDRKGALKRHFRLFMEMLGAKVFAEAGSAGAFIRGSDDPNAPRDERPRRKIEVSGFWIAKTPVTFAQLKKFAAATDRPKPTEDWPQTPLYDRTKPVDVVPANVSWVTADAYAKWACGRLPTEAEWMKAARGDKDARVYPWGDKWDPTKAVGIEMTYDRQRGGLAPVGMLPAGASPYGCLDMSDNVFEWVGDWYASDYWAKSPAKDPAGPATGRNRVLKGGSYCFSEDHARIDARLLCEPIQYDCMAIGFRYVIPDGDRTR